MNPRVVMPADFYFDLLFSQRYMEKAQRCAEV